MQKIAKNLPSGPIAQLCEAVSLQLRYVSTKNLLNSNISSTCPRNMGHVGPLTAELRSVYQFGALQQISTVSCLGFVTAVTSLNGSQPNFARCLAVSWAGTLYIHFRRLLPHNRILPGTKFNLRPSLALSHMRGVQKVRSLTRLLTRYVHHILSLCNIASCN